jgi:hypothetical protein
MFTDRACPDCADTIPVPITTRLSADGYGIDLIVDEDALYQLMLLHVKLNIDTHPTFWNKGDDNG